MSRPWTIERDFHFEQRERGRRKMEAGQAPAPPVREPGRVPRVARLMALAIRFDQLLREGTITDQAALADLSHVSRARISQIMNLLNLAPDIQEAILFLARTMHGYDVIHLRQLQGIASTLDWKKQRMAWQQLMRHDSSV
jgi:hypothetical protein